MGHVVGQEEFGGFHGSFAHSSCDAAAVELGEDALVDPAHEDVGILAQFGMSFGVGDDGGDASGLEGEEEFVSKGRDVGSREFDEDIMAGVDAVWAWAGDAAEDIHGEGDFRSRQDGDV